MQFPPRGAELPPQAVFETDFADLYFNTNSERDSSTADG